MKKILITIFLLFIAIISNAQFGAQNDISNSILNIQSMDVFDLDGDGNKDVVSAISFGGYDYQVVWNRNLGDGTFSTYEVLPYQYGAWSVKGSDIDNDGDMDIFVGFKDNPATGQNEAAVRWIENLGNNNFAYANGIYLGSCDHKVYPIDIDNDGDEDVISLDILCDYISLYENFGGTFGPRTKLDINTDGLLHISCADIDGDNDKDVLSVSKNDNKVAWYENTGGMIDTTQHIISTSINQPSYIHSEDIDGDGDEDVFTVSYNEDKIVWFENLGGGVFDTTQNIVSTENEPTRVFTVDYDNDNDMDIIITSFSNHKIAWHKNLGGGNIDTTQNIILIHQNQTTTPNLDTADINNDGLADFILGLDTEIFLKRNLGGGNYGFQEIIVNQNQDPKFVDPADIDNDGDIDLLIASLNGFYSYKNRGHKIFESQQLISRNSYAAVILASDVDQDGDKDAITATALFDNTIAWHENLGGGNFDTTKQIITQNVNDPRSIFCVDLDGDGDEDLLSASFFDNKIAWYENIGGGFGSQQIISNTMNSASSVFASDIDNDGDADVLCTSQTLNKIAWFENLGAGSFGQEQVISTITNNVRSIYTADLDNDGDEDILVASFSGNHITWHENLGSGSFGAQQIISTNAIGAVSIYAYDIDEDGDIDILSASESDDKIAWYENLGGGNFAIQQIINANAFRASCVRVADIDNDGDVEVISTDDNDFVGWYENYQFYSRQVRGTLFMDVNQNGIYDSLDLGFNLIGVYSNPFSDFTYSYQDGRYFMNFNDVQMTYQIRPNTPNYWGVVTDSLSYTIVVDSVFYLVDSLDFGFYPDTIITEVQPDLTGGGHRCNVNTNYWIDYRNTGTTIIQNGSIQLTLDDSIDFISASIIPDSIVGNDIYWHFDSLHYFSNSKITVEVQMPSLASWGDTLISYLSIYELDSLSNILYTSIDTLKQILSCSYDPNDKSVTPKGIGIEGFIPPNQELEYLIRFQNMGNDTAITVMVRDQLDANLNWSTLQPISSSDPVYIKVEQNGVVKFNFENIMLPDSGADFLGSQGFVKFKIKLDTGLAPLTPIYNTGHIYFDNNPAVITNTVLNTIECYSAPLAVISYSFPYLNANVTGNYTYQWFLNGNPIAGANADTLLPLVDGNYTVEITDSNTCYKLSSPYNYVAVGIEELGKLKTVVYPNPFSESTTILFDKNLNGEYDLLVYDIVGKKVKHINKIAGNKVEISKNEIGKGLFLAYVVNRTTGEKIFIEKLIVQ